MRAFTCKSDICFDFMQVRIGQLVFFVYTSTSKYFGNGASKDEWVGGIPQKSLINKMSFQLNANSPTHLGASLGMQSVWFTHI